MTRYDMYTVQNEPTNHTALSQCEILKQQQKQLVRDRNLRQAHATPPYSIGSSDVIDHVTIRFTV